MKRPSVSFHHIPLRDLSTVLMELGKMLTGDSPLPFTLPGTPIAGTGINLADLLTKVRRTKDGAAAGEEVGCASIKDGKRYVRLITVIVEAATEEAADLLVEDLEGQLPERHSHGEDDSVNARVLGTRIDTFTELAEAGINNDTTALSVFDARK